MWEVARILGLVALQTTTIMTCLIALILAIAGFFMGLAIAGERIAKTERWARFKQSLATSWHTIRQLPQLRHRLQLRSFAELRKEEGP